MKERNDDVGGPCAVPGTRNWVHLFCPPPPRSIFPWKGRKTLHKPQNEMLNTQKEEQGETDINPSSLSPSL